MARKVVFIALLIIVLVSLNWFKELVAQDLSNLTDFQKAQITQQLNSTNSDSQNRDVYRTPEIFNSGSSESIHSDSVNANGYGTNQALVGELSSQIISFEALRPFGLNLFEERREQGQPVAMAAAPDYILGPGDNLILYLWGRVEKQFNLTIDREGKLFVPEVGEILAYGISLDKFSKIARTRFSKVYSDFELTISLGKIRSIRLYITGEVQSPGAYTVSSLTSLFDAVYTAGGPNSRGSMRSIRLMRMGKEIADVDLYQLLLAGDNGTDLRLESGDVIHIPVAGPRVAIRGQVNRPAIYELKGGTTAAELLELSGKPTARAHLERVMLERISVEKEWEVIDLDLRSESGEQGKSEVLKDGDRLTVYSIFDFHNNRVGIFGQVKHPGYYERTDSTTVSTLIKQGQLTPFDVFYGRADLFRRNSDSRGEVLPIDLKAAMAGDPQHDVVLYDLDSLHIRSVDEVKWSEYVYIEGEVRKPGRYPLFKQMTVADLIFLAGSFNREASLQQAEIARMNDLGDVDIEYVSLVDSASQKLVLKDNDHIFIRQIPQWQQHPTVTIDGEVLYPGTYMLSSRNETIYDLIKRAGGFTPISFPTGIVMERTSIEQNLNRFNINEMIERSRPLVQDSTGAIKEQSIFEYNAASLNRIIIDMDLVISSHGKKGNIVLEQHDKIFVPSIPSGISVLGAVGANGTLKFEPGRKANNYIKLAGNFTRRADKSESKLIRANGEIVSGKKALGTKIELGDIIFVPTKIEKDRNWLKSFSTTISAVTGVLTSVFIISKL